MDKDTLLKLLKDGVSNSDFKLVSDKHSLVFEDLYALCRRTWDYDDYDMNDDHGHSAAKIPKEEVDAFLDEVVLNNQGDRIFQSTNLFYSKARDMYGGGEEINKKNYPGKARLTITIQDGTVQYKFLPTVPMEPQTRLQEGVDYVKE